MRTGSTRLRTSRKSFMTSCVDQEIFLKVCNRFGILIKRMSNFRSRTLFVLVLLEPREQCSDRSNPVAIESSLLSRVKMSSKFPCVIIRERSFEAVSISLYAITKHRYTEQQTFFTIYRANQPCCCCAILSVPK